MHSFATDLLYIKLLSNMLGKNIKKDDERITCTSTNKTFFFYPLLYLQLQVTTVVFCLI